MAPESQSQPQTPPSSRFDRPVVLGAGQVGQAVVKTLVARGHRPIVVTRSGTNLDGAIARQADMGNPATAIESLADATIVFTTAQPEYDRWAEEFPALQTSIVGACQAANVPLIVLENVYGYGPPTGPMTEDLPMRPTTKKGKVRATMWQELERLAASGVLQMAVVRASDFIGPGITGSAYGDRFFNPLLEGKAAQTVGDLGALHTVTFIPDLAEAMVLVAEDDTSWGRVWHAPSAPAVTQQQLAELAATSVGKTAKVKSAPVWLLRILGVFVAPIRETIEMLYEFNSDFVLDSSAFTERFGLEATPLSEAVAAVMQGAQASSGLLAK